MCCCFFTIESTDTPAVSGIFLGRLILSTLYHTWMAFILFLRLLHILCHAWTACFLCWQLLYIIRHTWTAFLFWCWRPRMRERETLTCCGRLRLCATVRREDYDGVSTGRLSIIEIRAWCLFEIVPPNYSRRCNGVGRGVSPQFGITKTRSEEAGWIYHPRALYLLQG